MNRRTTAGLVSAIATTFVLACDGFVDVTREASTSNSVDDSAGESDATPSQSTATAPETTPETPAQENVRGGPNWRGLHGQPSGHGLLMLVTDHLALGRYDRAWEFWCTWTSWSFEQLEYLQKELMANDADPGELGAWVRMTRCTRECVAELRDSLALTVASRCTYVLSICGETDDCRYLESQCYTTLGVIGDNVLRERAFEHVRTFEGPYRGYDASWESRLVVDAARYLSGCCSETLEYRREMTRLFERASFGRSLVIQERSLVPLVEDE